MKAKNVQLLARAGAEISTLLELAYGYQDRPRHLLDANPEGASVATAIFHRLIEEDAPVPASLAHLVCHLQRVTDVFADPANK